MEIHSILKLAFLKFTIYYFYSSRSYQQLFAVCVCGGFGGEFYACACVFWKLTGQTIGCFFGTVFINVIPLLFRPKIERNIWRCFFQLLNNTLDIFLCTFLALIFPFQKKIYLKFASLTCLLLFPELELISSMKADTFICFNHYYISSTWHMAYFQEISFRMDE